MSKAVRWALGMLVLLVVGFWLYQHNSVSPAFKAGVVTPLDSTSSASLSTTTSDAPATIDGDASSAGSSPAQPQAVAVSPSPAPAPSTQTLAPTPTNDTLSPEAPNGMAFGGKGRFQWYRQGNLTWRIDTVSGATCIDFATMDEWSKPIVYSHACANG